MKRIGTHIGILLMNLTAIAPFWMLHIKANFLYYITFHLVRYRKEVVFTNLRKSFPEKPEAEIIQIAKKFYRHLCDLLFETIKLRTISSKNLQKRMSVVNPELVNQYFDAGKSVLVLTMHYNNWEWQTILPQYLKHKCLLVYNPARNLVFDKYINRNRSRFGAELISTKKILPRVLKAQKENELTFTWLCADQRPKANTRFWTKFMNQDAGFFPGPENLARHTNQVVLYQHTEKIARGKYETRFDVLCENPELVPAEGILKMYVEKIETIIREKPAYYLWSHKRWKHKRPNHVKST